MTKEKTIKLTRENNKHISCNHKYGTLELSVIDTKNDKVYYITACKRCGYELNINY